MVRLDRPLTVAAAMMALGIAARLAGLPISDFTLIFRRAQLGRAPLPIPYVDYPLEYPVGLGLLIWLANAVAGDMTAFFCVTAGLAAAAGLALVWLARAFEGANLWLLALAPALPLYVALNWDLVALAPTVAALLLFRHDRDAGGALLLTVAVWTKLFPVVLLPLVLLDRALRRAWRGAATIASVFALGSLLVNAPFALERAPAAAGLPGVAGWRLREGWLYFFRFHQERPREVNGWNLLELVSLPLTTAQINRYSALLLAAGLGAIMLAMAIGPCRARGDMGVRDGARGGDRLVPAGLAALGRWLFVNKVYSQQYSLWLLVPLALLAAPPAIGVSFAGVDLADFVASFTSIYLRWLGSPATDPFQLLVLLPVTVLREGLILAIVVWAVRLMGRGSVERGAWSVACWAGVSPIGRAPASTLYARRSTLHDKGGSHGTTGDAADDGAGDDRLPGAAVQRA